ncbi:hypothetical protein [Paenibacillus polymyxa]|uniref:hypothetical protein n=1 Tax=Paenibacillus polymyxa TaxID=1406 RepID=UPI00287F725C|nr:hypothetical protein [Paenibacillus polymyxa]
MKIPKQMHSSDYDLLIDQALAIADKEWFEELVKKKNELAALEKEVRRDFGFDD